MTYVKWTLAILFWAIVLAFLHYTLPQRDIVRIVNTEIQRIDFGDNSLFWSRGDSGQATDTGSRDVRFIQTVRPNGRPMVYRNEDTGWGWPPYFKFDSANLQTRASDMVSTAADPQWVAMRHYGWRFEWLSVYPNALSLKPVESPDVRLIPWFNIIFLTLLVLFGGALYIRWRRFRERRVDPLLEEVDDRADEATRKVRGWFRREPRP